MQPIESSGYSIYFNQDCYPYLQQLLAGGQYSGIFILTDENTSTHCLPGFLANLATDLPFEIIEIEAGEEHKNITTCTEVWHALTELGAERKSLLINLGGGVVTDLGGFVASTFKRGMDFINVPTTLLSMVDASVGGKTGVDLGVLKNQIGVITNPVAVLVDTTFLETLPASQMRSGLAEMLKHGLIADKAYWEQFANLGNLTTDDMDGLVYRSVEIKNEVVKADPFEKGLRKILNFGHTLGHAIESYCLENPEKETLLHGEAIAIGMVLESYISWQQDLISEAEYINIKEVISGIYTPVSFTPEDINVINTLLVHDKKNENGEIRFTLLEATGRAVINKTVENTLILKAFEDYQN
ncbi:3-dehydroquinate synthase [Flavobacterium akiainvivens]|uniref:3-dehydroquinate synthase n=1 Tax=Flavobacterium akiainvivens TaxID=1202724 RepID=A0A0M8MG49_9FLAO|nr:3-dehydroquinate synthase [Flavobacterium akiainvivens]KOS08174.1 3-dehydroquinate synthase [Flavobacterium akiainvivens]SFQ51952.1 3-dehydroquinate synthase [Flavobacterium akiainvivens]